MNDIDPLYDYHLQRPMTDEEIKAAYLKFREGYYKELDSHARDTQRLNAISKHWMTFDGSAVGRVEKFVEYLITDNNKLRDRLSAIRGKTFWRRMLSLFRM